MSETRTAILDAALATFAERGFYGAAMPALAQRAGVASGTPYRHFESKEALVNAVYLRCKTELTEALFADFPFDAPEREQHRVFWWRMVAFFRARPEVFDFLELHHHQPYLDPANLDLERQALAPVIAFFLHGRRARVTKAMAPEALGAIVWGIFAGLRKAEGLGHLTVTDDVWAQAERCAWDAVRRPPEPEEIE